MSQPGPLYANNLAGLNGIRHGFFTRKGGVSTGIYEGLNVGLGSDDDRTAVLENRRRVAQALGHGNSPLNTLYQVHSPDAVVIDATLSEPVRADALVTKTPGVVIGALAADCTPVLFADAEAGVIGAAHAGWRGAKAGVLESTINAMLTAGARREAIHAAVGPTISQANYEVGPEFKDAFLAEAPQTARFFVEPGPGKRAHFDLPGFVMAKLEAAGLASVARQAPCTYENESLLFSYRRSRHRSEADYGRQISAIVLS